jgi:hypothetical protein
MNPRYLTKLINRYGDDSTITPEGLDGLREKYRQFKSTMTIDLATVALSLSINDIKTATADPIAMKAISETSPTFDPDDVVSYSDEEVMGYINTAKGKYFEYLVVDKLNEGEAVGDVILPDGYTASVAQSMTQPGWDIQINDETGNAVEHLQLKATESISYIKHALDRYPDIKIISTDEVGDKLHDSHMVLDSNISESELEHVVTNAMGIDSEGILDEFWASFNPLVPLLLIAGTQGYRVYVAQQNISSALEVAQARAARSLASGTVGAMTKALFNIKVAIPAALLTGWIFDRSQNIHDLIQACRMNVEKQKNRTTFYKVLLGRK